MNIKKDAKFMRNNTNQYLEQFYNENLEDIEKKSKKGWNSWDIHFKVSDMVEMDYLKNKFDKDGFKVDIISTPSVKIMRVSW